MGTTTLRSSARRARLAVGVWMLCVAAWTAGAQGASSPESALARKILDQAGVQGGLVVHVGCGDGKLTAALRANERYLVQGLERDAASVAAARATIRSLGLTGSVTAAACDGEHLPYADNVVNLLVVSRRYRVGEAEMRRVLAPLGVACVAQGGAWEKLAEPWPKAIDEWTHFLHGADNNAVARDTRVAPPRYTQWVAGPRWARSHDHLASVSAVVTAAGRLFAIVDEGPIAAVAAPSKWMLVARDAFSGVLLWKRPVSPWENQLRPFRSGPAELPRRLVAVGDRVYATLGYGKGVTALDAATGEVVHSYEGTENAHEIVCHDGVLYAVVAAPLEEPSPTTGKVLRKFDLWRGGYQEYVTQYPPKHVRAFDAKTGRLLWKKQDAEAVRILPLTLIASGDRVFCQNETHVVALGARSGEVVWRAERPSVRQRYAWLTPTLVVADGVVISADRAHGKPVDTGGEDAAQLEWRVSANHKLTEGEMMAFSAATGEKLWTVPCHEGFNSPVDVFVIGGKVYSGVLAWGRQPGITKVYDVKTGKVVAERSPDQKKYTLGFGHHRCYRDKATVNYIIQGRAGVEFLDVDADRAVADHWVRGGCQYGILPANGLVYAPTHPCACYIAAKLSGFNALAAERQQAGAAKQAARLERGPAYGEPAGSEPAAGNAEDWPTYRHDAARTGATKAALPPTLGPRWSKALAGPLTAPVVADGRLYVAQRDAHTMHALRAEDGSPLWHFTAGGRVDSPPTLHAGRAYFGSADGCIYCVRAKDGALVWRFRVAPEQRQVVAYGQIESVWPLHGTVLVRRDPQGAGRAIAYAAAGRSSYVDEGLAVCAVDAITGEQVASRRICDRDPKTGREPQDVIKGARMPGAIPDVLSTDGQSLFMRHQRLSWSLEPLAQDVEHLFSSVGFVDGAWWHRTYWQLGTAMGTGYGGWPSAGNARISGRLLVVAGERVYGFGRKSYAIIGSHPGLNAEHQFFAAHRKLVATPKPQGTQAKRKRRRSRTRVDYCWGKPLPFLVRAMALAGDTLFVAGPSDVGDLAAPKPRKPVHLWAVSAEDGSKRSECELAASPVFDSFAACSGRLYFTTVDGRVVCYAGK